MNLSESVFFSNANQLKGQGSLYAMCWDQEENTVLVAGSTGIVAKWDICKSAEPVAIAQAGETIYTMQQTKNFATLFLGTASGHLIAINYKNRSTRKINLHENGIFCIVVSEKNNLLITGGGDGFVSFCELTTLKLVARIQLSVAKVRGLCVDNEELLLAIADGEGKVTMMEISTKKITYQAKTHNLSANCVLFTDGNTLLSGGRDAMLCVLDLSTEKIIEKIPAHNYAVYQISLSANKKYIATASRDKTLKIWDSKTLTMLQRLNKEKDNGHLNSVNNILWKGNRTIVSCSDDRSVIVWKKKEE